MALDIDLPSADSSRKSYILAFLADCQGKLVVWYDDDRRLFVLIWNDDLLDLCRAEDACDQHLRVLAPVDDIDFFSVKFIYYSLNSASSGSYA